MKSGPRNSVVLYTRFLDSSISRPKFITETVNGRVTLNPFGKLERLEQKSGCFVSMILGEVSGRSPRLLNTLDRFGPCIMCLQVG